MSFREQQTAALNGTALYGIFSASADMISKPEWEKFRFDDLNGIVAAMPRVPFRACANLPFDPQDLYAEHNTTPSQGYHLWEPMDALINNAKILPSPLIGGGGIIGRVQHNNCHAGYVMHGGEKFGKGWFPFKDPVFAVGTLGVPFVEKFNHLAQYKQ